MSKKKETKCEVCGKKATEKYEEHNLCSQCLKNLDIILFQEFARTEDQKDIEERLK